MRLSRFVAAIAAFVSLQFPTIVAAQTANDVVSDTGFSLGGVTLYVGEKAWFSAWDTALLDARIRFASATSAPVIETYNASSTTNKLLPITTVGARFKQFSLTANVIPTTRFASSNTATGTISRSEFDINLGYYINDYLSAALIYKQGKVSETTTAYVTQTLDASSAVKLKGVLVGFAASAPLTDLFRFYGTLAFGPGRAENVSLGQTHTRLNYSIGELGLSYNAPKFSPRTGLTLTAGYRVQVVELKNLPAPTFSAAGNQPIQLSEERRRVTSTTHGPTLGLTVSFL